MFKVQNKKCVDCNEACLKVINTSLELWADKKVPSPFHCLLSIWTGLLLALKHDLEIPGPIRATLVTTMALTFVDVAKAVEKGKFDDIIKERDARQAAEDAEKGGPH